MFHSWPFEFYTVEAVPSCPSRNAGWSSGIVPTFDMTAYKLRYVTAFTVKLYGYIHIMSTEQHDVTFSNDFYLLSLWRNFILSSVFCKQRF